MTEVITRYHSLTDLPLCARDFGLARIIASSPNSCWKWRGTVDRYGYGAACVSHRGKRFRVGAHRLAYLILRGPVEPGLVLDHTCRNRACVNPWHMDQVTNRTNVQRGEVGTWERKHCKRGHEFTPENTVRNARGRLCLKCRTAWREGYSDRG